MKFTSNQLFVSRLRQHKFCFKPNDWDTVDAFQSIDITPEDFAKLHHVTYPMNALEHPLSDLKLIIVPFMFVLHHGENTYLVNTEGFSYCRYIAPASVITISPNLVDLIAN